MKKPKRLPPLQENERAVVAWYLRKNNWERARTAAALQITRTTLWRKMKKYNIKTPPRKLKRTGENE